MGVVCCPEHIDFELLTTEPIWDSLIIELNPVDSMFSGEFRALKRDKMEIVKTKGFFEIFTRMFRVMKWNFHVRKTFRNQKLKTETIFSLATIHYLIFALLTFVNPLLFP